jgi:hypothetical protein
VLEFPFEWYSKEELLQHYDAFPHVLPLISTSETGTHWLYETSKKGVETRALVEQFAKRSHGHFTYPTIKIESEGGPVEITATYPAGIVGTTFDNLMAAAQGEHEEFVELYPAFGAIAEEEGFIKIANQFRMIAKVEKEHEDRYRKLAENVKNEKVFAKDEIVAFIEANADLLATKD